MNTASDLEQYIADKLATTTSEDERQLQYISLAKEIHADQNMTYLLMGKSSYTPDETIISAKVNELFGGMPTKVPSKVKHKAKIAIVCIYSLLWVACALACIAASSLFLMLIGNTWGNSYGYLSGHACDLMSAVGFGCSTIVGVYMWFSLFGIPRIFLSPSWLISKMGLGE